MSVTRVPVLIVVYRVKPTVRNPTLVIMSVEQVSRSVLNSVVVSYLLAAVTCHDSQLDIIVIVLVVVLADT